jgi:hypothetical protein
MGPTRSGVDDRNRPTHLLYILFNGHQRHTGFFGAQRVHRSVSISDFCLWKVLFSDRGFNVVDSRAQYSDSSVPNPYLAYAPPNAVPEAYDIPIGLVNRVLYDTNNRPR